MSFGPPRGSPAESSVTKPADPSFRHGRFRRGSDSKRQGLFCHGRFGRGWRGTRATFVTDGSRGDRGADRAPCAARSQRHPTPLRAGAPSPSQWHPPVPDHTPGVERSACLASSNLVRRIAHVHGAPPNSPSPTVRAALASIAATAAGSAPTSTATDSTPTHGATIAGPGHRRLVVGLGLRTRRFDRTVRENPRLAHQRRARRLPARPCAASWPARSTANTSRPCTLGRAVPARRSVIPIRCDTASVHRTNWPACARCSTTSARNGFLLRVPSAGFWRTLRRRFRRRERRHDDLRHEDLLAVEPQLGDALADVVERAVRAGLVRPAVVQGRVPAATSSLTLLTSMLR